MKKTILHNDPELEADVKGFHEIMLIFVDGYEIAIGDNYEYRTPLEFLLSRLSDIGAKKLAEELDFENVDELVAFVLESNDISSDIDSIVYDSYNGIYGDELGE